KQFITLLTALTSSRAGMSFVDNDKLRALFGKSIAAVFALDVVQGDHSKWILRKDGTACGQAPFQPRCCAGAHHHRVNVEAVAEFFLPLFGQVWRAKDS